MTVKPIDLQSNIAHMHEVAKSEHGKAAALVEGQHSLEKDAEEKAKRVKDRLNENKQAEKTAIKREEGQKKKDKKKKKRLFSKKLESDSSAEDKNLVRDKNANKDKKIGVMIDIKR